MEQPYKVAFVLGGDYGSTGRIALAVRAALMEAGDETFFVARKIVSLQSGYLDYRDYHLSLQINRLTTKFNGLDGFKNKQFTNKAIKALDDFKPDLIYIHNLHGYYINFPMLFAYAAKRDIPVVWTLHDCWAFTGKCAYFTNVGCEKWKKRLPWRLPNK
jgi:putative colanic acid biosynthesis glycosyltransferase